jgi:enediyne biosynthesis protein E4
LMLHYADFDGNGSIDPIYSYFANNDYRPYPSLDLMASQLPMIKKRFLKYKDYASASTSQILKGLNTSQAKELLCHNQASSLLINNGANGFELTSLPRMAQVSPMRSILIEDVNNDKMKDIICIGNNYHSEVVGGRYDANHGQIWLNRGELKFELLPNYLSGFSTSGDNRFINQLSLANGKFAYLVTQNNGQLETFVRTSNSIN